MSHITNRGINPNNDYNSNFNDPVLPDENTDKTNKVSLKSLKRGNSLLGSLKRRNSSISNLKGKLTRSLSKIFTLSKKNGILPNDSPANKVKFNEMLGKMGISSTQLKELRNIAIKKMSNDEVVEIPKEELEELGLKDLRVNILPEGNILMHEGDPIGKGAENTVWKGAEMQVDETVWFQDKAVILNRKMDDFQDPKLKKLLAKLTSLDHICPTPVFVKVVDGIGNSLMKTRLYSAGDAGELIGKLSFDDALRVCLGAAVGLNELNELGVLHCDINPGNIFLREDFKSYITADIGDHGEACFKDDVKFRRGSPSYSSPEMSPRKAKNSEETELWALGLVVWQLFYGEKNEEGPEGYFPPFIDELRVQIAEEGRAFEHCITEKLGGITEGAIIHDNLGFSDPEHDAEGLIHKLIKGLLSLDPNSRPKMHEAVIALKKAAKLKGISFDTSSPRRKKTRTRSPKGSPRLD